MRVVESIRYKQKKKKQDVWLLTRLETSFVKKQAINKFQVYVVKIVQYHQSYLKHYTEKVTYKPIFRDVN